MKLLVMEYVTGGGLRGVSVAPGLAREGGLMRQALINDLLAADPAIELVVVHDDRFPVSVADPRVKYLSISSAEAFATGWRDAVHHCDAVWPIAPETGGLMTGLCTEVEAAGKMLLNSPACAVRLAGSKKATTACLQAHGLPVVETLALGDYRALSETGAVSWSAGAVVVKPDDGVGCEGACVVPGSQPASESETADLIVQPLVEGEPLSLSVLFARGQARLLSVNRQMIERRADGFALTGCRVNALSDDDGYWQTLAAGIATALPELWGYAGVDLILTQQGPRILEINPRLTTSYAGLRRATGTNPAALVMELLRNGELPLPQVIGGRSLDLLLEPDREH